MWNRLHSTLTLLLIAAVGYLYYSNYSKKRVAFVDSQEVLEKYAGMEEARNLYQIKVDEWRKGLEEHMDFFQKKSDEFEQNKHTLAKQENENIIADLQRMEQELTQLSQNLQNKAVQEEERMIQGVLNQVNDLIKRYGEEHNIDIILGTTLSGNILYGDDAIDITEAIIKQLNKEHKGK